jgi:2-polyprenyl-3-methyl-5-hydroxy-6-metoxy-1,4-benzoquinol methylase
MSDSIIEKLALGDVEGALSISDDEAVKNKIEESLGHLKDVDRYKGAYGFSEEGNTDLPPEALYQTIPVDTRQEAILFFMKMCHGRTLLDIACSNGILLAKASLEGLIDDGVGVEISKKRVEVAKKVMEFRGLLNIHIDHSMFEEFETNAKFDIITAGEVLEHIIDPVQFLNKAVSYLKDNGSLITTVPISRPPLSEQEKVSVMEESNRAHVRYLDRERMLEIADKVGLYEAGFVIEGSSWVNLISMWKKK